MAQSTPKIWLLGASLETTNMGLSALAESTLKCIFTRWPDAEVMIPTHNQDTTPQVLHIMQRDIPIQRMELWYGRNIFKHQNIYLLFILALFSRLLPFHFFRQFLRSKNSSFDALMNVDFVADITGGDSFTDLYKMPRLMRGNLFKFTVLLAGKPLVFLPQTYGPFKRSISRLMLKMLLKRAKVIYSRDQAGIEYVQQVLGNHAAKKHLQFSPDVAFVLEPEKLDTTSLQKVQALKQQDKKVIGLNVSGLLYNKSLQNDDWFDLKGFYPNLVESLIHQFLQDTDHAMVLVSHVIAPKHLPESDPLACERLYEKMQAQYGERIVLAEGDLNHKQVKYLISQCDFFMGSRMHACIAAISQCIPAVGLAYSGKFIGVFESVGVGDTVVDLRTETNEEVLKQVAEIYQQRENKAKKLQETIPDIQQHVLQLFDNLSDFSD
ncbi:polysaccharide pyruvyl transferase family protein [Candidatus Albibeggiatoa sp. nov. NOAA]|uniref:polysaccharide pyruvyl transferase family protein n=1 Tax=Candidatus Albibeggiatoa sp. nov. NOAA TaxID=3162724 RepID=UPI0032F0D8AA|nr:polysaccharide pyruvyl transferase family protein [Thiotrichaceae bacterium]